MSRLFTPRKGIKMKYIAKGEITETSELHNTPSGRAEKRCNTFAAARFTIDLWLASTYARADHNPVKAPRGAGFKYGVSDADWTYWIERGI